MDLLDKACELELRQQIIDVAKTWLNTPFVDGQGKRGAGVDCAYFPCRVYAEVGIVKPFDPPYYSPQLMLHSDNDRTYVETIEKWGGREIPEAEAAHGDMVIYHVARTYAHGGIIVKWPDLIIHPVLGRGVIYSHGTNEGFLQRRKRRFFTVF